MNPQLLFGLLLIGFACAEPVTVSTELTEEEEAYEIKSPNYPEDAPADLDKTWVISAPEGKTISLECDDIRLFEETPCGPWVLTIKDGEETKEICTSVFDFNMQSKTNSIEVNLKIGPYDRGFLSCFASIAN